MSAHESLSGTAYERPHGLRWPETRRRLLDTVFPPHCVGCGARREWLCARCLARIESLPLPLCGRCHQHVSAGEPHGCRIGPATPVTVSAIGVYAGPLRQAVHALKYNGRHGVAATLTDLLAARIAPLITCDDALVAVPLHPSRERERGYNQSAILAAELAHRLPLRLERHALRRTRATTDQVGLSERRRAVNVQGAFAADASSLAGCRVWLLDDVYTTGATLRAAAHALRVARVREVRGVVVAMTGRGGPF